MRRLTTIQQQPLIDQDLKARLLELPGVLKIIKKSTGLKAQYQIEPTQPVCWYAIPLADCPALGIEAVNPYANYNRVPCWVRTEDGYAVTAVRYGEIKGLKWGPRSLRAPAAKMVPSPVAGQHWLVVDHPEVGTGAARPTNRDFPRNYDWYGDPRTKGYIKYFLATVDEVEAGRRFFGLTTVSQCRRLFRAMMTDAKVRKEVSVSLRQKISEALKNRGIGIDDAESYMLDTYIGIIEDNKGSNDVRQVEVALKGLDRIKELIVDTKMPEGGEVFGYAPAAEDVARLDGQELPALPPVAEDDASASE